MQTRFPDKIDLRKLAVAGERLQDDVPLAGMPRLVSMLDSVNGGVHLDLSGGVDEQGIKFVTGHLDTIVEMTCQRCLESIPLRLSVDFHLGIINSETQAAVLSDVYEPLVVPESGMSLAELAEDELILALPVVAMCEEPDKCGNSPLANRIAVAEKSNPFAALADLLKDSKNQE